MIEMQTLPILILVAFCLYGSALIINDRNKK